MFETATEDKQTSNLSSLICCVVIEKRQIGARTILKRENQKAPTQKCFLDSQAPIGREH